MIFNVPFAYLKNHLISRKDLKIPFIDSDSLLSIMIQSILSIPFHPHPCCTESIKVEMSNSKNVNAVWQGEIWIVDLVVFLVFLQAWLAFSKASWQTFSLFNWNLTKSLLAVNQILFLWGSNPLWLKNEFVPIENKWVENIFPRFQRVRKMIAREFAILRIFLKCR